MLSFPEVGKKAVFLISASNEFTEENTSCMISHCLIYSGNCICHFLPCSEEIVGFFGVCDLVPSF